MRFKKNRHFEAQAAADPKMGRFLKDVAEDAVTEVEVRLPHPSVLGGIAVTGSAERTADGYEGVVRVSGSGWHLWEFGTVNHRAIPAIRPGVQAALSLRDGRLGRE